MLEPPSDLIDLGASYPLGNFFLHFLWWWWCGGGGQVEGESLFLNYHGTFFYAKINGRSWKKCYD